jgi:enoyl-[acyl-carrier-protein] reductase (NADH)
MDGRGVGSREIVVAGCDAAEVLKAVPQALKEMWAKGIPPRRMPRIADVANAAVLMASDYASATTGEVANFACRALAD